MHAVWIILLIMAALWLLSLFRVGAEVRYSEAGLRLLLRAGPLRVTLFPRPKKKPPRARKAPNSGEKEGRAPPKPQKPRRASTLTLLREALPVICDAAGRLRRKIQIDRLDLNVTVAAPSPAAAALAYGGINAAMGMIIPLLENNFIIKKRQFQTWVDYDRKAPAVDLRAAGSLTLGQGAALAFRLAFQMLRIFWNMKQEQKQKEAV